MTKNPPSAAITVDAARLARELRERIEVPEPLQQRVPDLAFDPLRQQALVHEHCHQKPVLDADSEQALLRRLELDLRLPDSGCCGMAGSFGFEAHKYEVSMRCAERVLLRAVRAAGDEALIVADGYSCREQIVQSTGREVLHTAEVLERAIPKESK